VEVLLLLRLKVEAVRAAGQGELLKSRAEQVDDAWPVCLLSRQVHLGRAVC
jgi:hypothetical protein